MTLFLYLESVWIIITFQFFIGYILDTFYTERSMTLWHTLITWSTERENVFIKDNILLFFFITYIIWPLSAIASLKLISYTLIIFYRYFIIQTLYDIVVRISATIKIIQFPVIST